MSSRRTRHKSAVTARSEDLRLSPEAQTRAKITTTAPSRTERRPHTPTPRPKGGRGFPSASLKTSNTGSGHRQDGTRATATAHNSPSTTPPSRPWHRPAPELLARPPTSEAPTFPGPPPQRPNCSRCGADEDENLTARINDLQTNKDLKLDHIPGEGQNGDNPHGCRASQIWGWIGNRPARAAAREPIQPPMSRSPPRQGCASPGPPGRDSHPPCGSTLVTVRLQPAELTPHVAAAASGEAAIVPSAPSTESHHAPASVAPPRDGAARAANSTRGGRGCPATADASELRPAALPGGGEAGGWGSSAGADLGFCPWTHGSRGTKRFSTLVPWLALI
jgi:hypothetical protein